MAFWSLIPYFPYVSVPGWIVVACFLFLIFQTFRANAEARTKALQPALLHTSTVYPCAMGEAQGRRAYMEDRHVAAGDLRGDPSASLYAVFDGHAGSIASEFCSERIVGALTSDPAYPSNPVRALTNTFLGLDSDFLEYARAARPPLDDGTTALAMLAHGNILFVANAGDSRAVLVHHSGLVEPLSEDHKPNRPDEIIRIKAAGGTVYFHGVWRVGGLLAVSRAIGDRILKPAVTARPDVSTRVVTGDDMCVVLATDGLWDVYTSVEVGTTVHAVRQGGGDMKKVAATLVSGALGRGSTDNITVVVVDLTSMRTGCKGPVSASVSTSTSLPMAGAAALSGSTSVAEPGTGWNEEEKGEGGDDDEDDGSHATLLSTINMEMGSDSEPPSDGGGGGRRGPSGPPSLLLYLPWAVTYPMRLALSYAAALLRLPFRKRAGSGAVVESHGPWPRPSLHPPVASSSATTRTLASARRRTASVPVTSPPPPPPSLVPDVGVVAAEGDAPLPAPPPHTRPPSPSQARSSVLTGNLVGGVSSPHVVRHGQGGAGEREQVLLPLPPEGGEGEQDGAPGLPFALTLGQACCDEGDGGYRDERVVAPTIPQPVRRMPFGQGRPVALPL